MKRHLLFAVLVLMVWTMLALAFFQQPEKPDRVAIVLTAIMIAILAIMISGSVEFRMGNRRILRSEAL